MDHCTPRSKPSAGTTGAGASRSVSLTVLPGTSAKVRRSSSGWKRALVLTGVWVLMIAHFVQWVIMGTTISPVEPSEAMATSKSGIVNAGTVFFACAILATLVLGRWFCGWGCHWVALQDGTAWLLRKVGVRPKPFRSRLLVWAPLLLACYMFLWPVVYRFAIGPFLEPGNPALRWPGFTTHYVTTGFWDTFPGILMAVPFVLVCGAFIIYLLGSKGYCTYACPYGGFFGPADEAAPMRIVVDADKCHQCGHCTAVCSSNVRVHEEVRDYGMVVDPGCMKCLDCVSVCPNEALSFGLAKPSARVKREGTRAAESAARRYDLTWPEEVALAALAFAVFLGVRGDYFGLPLLFASGVAVCTAFIAWKGWRVVRDRNASFHQWQLRFHGAWRPAGVAWVAGTAGLLGALGYIAMLNLSLWRAERVDLRVRVPAEVVYAEQRTEPPAQVAADARAAIELYRFASPAPDGIAVLPMRQGYVDMRVSWLLAVLGDLPQAEAVLRRAWERDGPSEVVAAAIARTVRVQANSLDRSLAWYDEQLAAHPEWQGLREEQVAWLDFNGLNDRILPSARAGYEAMPDNLLAMRRLSLSLIEYGQDLGEIEEGVRLIIRTLEIEPDNAAAHAALARGYLKLNRNAEARAEIERAAQLDPSNEVINGMLEEIRAITPGVAPTPPRPTG